MASTIRLCRHCCRATEGMSRCPDCQRKRVPYDRKRRRAIARAVFPASLRAEVLAKLRRRVPLGEVARSLQVTVQQIHGFAHTNPAFRRELDAALLAGRDPKLRHGDPTTYRHHGCRCPDCRAAKRASGAYDYPPRVGG